MKIFRNVFKLGYCSSIQFKKRLKQKLLLQRSTTYHSKSMFLLLNKSILECLAIYRKNPQKLSSASKVNTSSRCSQPSTSINNDGEAQTRFGNVKSISSTQYFDENSTRNTVAASLARFDGVAGFGSADLYGRGQTVEPTLDDMIADFASSMRTAARKVYAKYRQFCGGVQR